MRAMEVTTEDVLCAAIRERVTNTCRSLEHSCQVWRLFCTFAWGLPLSNPVATTPQFHALFDRRVRHDLLVGVGRSCPTPVETRLFDACVSRAPGADLRTGCNTLELATAAFKDLRAGTQVRSRAFARTFSRPGALFLHCYGTGSDGGVGVLSNDVMRAFLAADMESLMFPEKMSACNALRSSCVLFLGHVATACTEPLPVVPMLLTSRQTEPPVCARALSGGLPGATPVDLCIEDRWHPKAYTCGEGADDVTAAYCE